MNSRAEEIKKHSKPIGFIFIFNLIVGTGALALPKAFQDCGWALGSAMLLLLALLSFIPMTWVIEVLSYMNARRKLQVYRHNGELPLEDPEADDASQTLLITSETQFEHENSETVFSISEKFEMSDMVKSLYGPIVNVLFYVNICVYLYGDLSVYAAAVSKSMRNVLCTYHKIEALEGPVGYSSLEMHALSDNGSLSNGDPCWNSDGISRMSIYRLFVFAFCCTMLPLFSRRANWLQITTTVTRWFAIAVMLCMAVYRIARIQSNHEFPLPHPVAFRPSGLLSLFGVCVYSFMCHHSLPRLITPISDSDHGLLWKILVPVYSVILLLYIALSVTAVFAFDQVEDFYTLNFIPRSLTAGTVPVMLLIIDYFLALFPVFTLSSNFPIIGATLVGNLKTLASRTRLRNLAPTASEIVFPILAILPALLLALVTDDLTSLVGFTGAVAGSGIQYVFPALLVDAARKEAQSEQFQRSLIFVNSGEEINASRTLHERSQMDWGEFPHASPFRSRIWIGFIIVWAVTCAGLVLGYKIYMAAT